MIRSEGLIDKLIATLHFHGYLHLISSNIYTPDDGPLNIVASESKIKLIQDYIDDVFIDLFFRTYEFKPIIIPKGYTINQYTKDGVKSVNSGLELNLNNVFDRYTFVNCISQAFNNGYLGQIFPNNDIGRYLYIIPKTFGPIWEGDSLILRSPCGDEFEQYLNSLYGSRHSKYNPQYRANNIVEFARLYHTKLCKYSNKDLTQYGIRHICGIQWLYNEIKNLNLFGENTVEDILLIYCLLVDKFKLEEDHFLKIVSLFAAESIFLNDFHKFELMNHSEEHIKPFIRDRDLFLRFTSATKSKAVKFSFPDSQIAELSFFNEKSIKTVRKGNTMPLPYLYQDLYQL